MRDAALGPLLRPDNQPTDGTARTLTLSTDQFVGGVDFGDYSPPVTTTYSRTANLTIRDLRTTTSTLTVSGGSGFIFDVNVKVNISHTNDADLSITLVAPDGTRVALAANNGGTGDHFTNTVFDDQAAVPITSGVAPFTGSYRPVNPLGPLYGKTANGNWTLEVYDGTRKNTGTLVNWSLIVTGSATGRPLQAAGGPAAGQAWGLTSAALRPIVREAIRRWTLTGLTGDERRLLRHVRFQIADLDGPTLGLATGTTVTLDRNAAGYGWFVDRTARNDSEFTRAGNQGEQGRMDLLTVAMHELGHILGRDHANGGVMAEVLDPGVRVSIGRDM